MKTITVNKIHAIYFETTRESYRINEIIDEQGEIHFSQGNVGHVADMINIPGKTNIGCNRMLLKAHNLFEAKAALVERIIETKTLFTEIDKKIPNKWFKKFLSTNTEHLPDFRPLMRELKDLPLLIGFFTNPATLNVFEEVLKNG